MFRKSYYPLWFFSNVILDCFNYYVIFQHFNTVSPACAFQSNVLLEQRLEGVSMPGVFTMLDHSHPMEDQLCGPSHHIHINLLYGALTAIGIAAYAIKPMLLIFFSKHKFGNTSYSTFFLWDSLSKLIHVSTPWVFWHHWTKKTSHSFCGFFCCCWLVLVLLGFFPPYYLYFSEVSVELGFTWSGLGSDWQYA